MFSEHCLDHLVFGVIPQWGLQFLGQNVLGRSSSSCEELPVYIVITRAYFVLGLRHESLVRERMPAKLCFE